MKITTRFFLLLLASIIVPILVISTTVVIKVRNEAQANFVERSNAELTHIDSAISIYLNGLAEDAAFLASTDVVKQLDDTVTTYMGKPGGMMRASQNGGIEAEVYHLLRQFGEARPDLAYVYLGMSNGGYIVWPESNVPDDYDPRTRPWYKTSIGQNRAVRIPAYIDLATGNPLLDYMHSFSAKQGIKGTIGVDVSLQKFTEIVASIKFGQSGYVMMIEDTGAVLADPSNPDNNFKSFGEIADYQRIASQGQGLVETEIGGESWYANVYLSPATGWKMVGMIPTDEVYQNANAITWNIIVMSVIMVAIFMGIGFVLMKLISRPMQTITDGLENIASGDGDLSKRLNIDSQDESGQMARAFNRFAGTIAELVDSIKEKSGQLNDSADTSAQLSQQMKGVASSQLAAVEQVSTAFHEMVATSNEVANNCSQAASAADDSQGQVEQGHQLIQQTVSAVNQLETTLNQSNQAMRELSEDSQNITVILDTIRGIAEQTNLLALNAAIEAARAGEQGRGFAVVADEVRTLAGRTAESTEEIDKLLTKLRSQTDVVAQSLNDSIKHSEQSVQATDQTSSVFESIMESVLTIRDMTTQIAASAEEQHLVAEEINRNITDIHDGANQSNEGSLDLETKAEELNQLAQALAGLVSRFRT
ncbi:methyl-accepting chemotaxis protein [Aliagarivorans marinus]|uniref:methyl-accepting chemotaxis protein n=1 Tax=Aliagarivorans marinus TaxID=561965 RepID=UPI00041B1CC4|nr:methyl-accepting chemotaxis protein [Aliagarivorans marinus]